MAPDVTEPDAMVRAAMAVPGATVLGVMAALAEMAPDALGAIHGGGYYRACGQKAAGLFGLRGLLVVLPRER